MSSGIMSEKTMPEFAPSLSPVIWDGRMLAELINLWVANKSTSAIAKRLGIPRSCVIGKLKSLRVDALLLSKRQVERV